MTTQADLGTEPKNVQLREDDSAALAAIAEQLSRTGATSSPFTIRAADWVLGRGGPRSGCLADPAALIAGHRSLNLNESQRQAVEQALAADATFIWGPPGTGKTAKPPASQQHSELRKAARRQ